MRKMNLEVLPVTSVCTDSPHSFIPLYINTTFLIQ